MSKYAMFFYTRCTDFGREDEFNSWYSHVHIPELRQAAGLTSARRFVCSEPKCRAKYLAVYEFETDNLQESKRSFFQIVHRCFTSGRHIDCIESVVAADTPGVTVYRELAPDDVRCLPCPDYPKGVPEALKKLADPGWAS